MSAPNFMFLTESKIEITKETYKGKYLYISFYSSDSPEFIQEYPLYDKLRILYGKKVSFLFVSLDERLKTKKNIVNLLLDLPDSSKNSSNFLNPTIAANRETYEKIALKELFKKINSNSKPKNQPKKSPMN